ncbi:MAG: OmpA family protein, partial [Pseudomonadota bacterium]
MIRRLRSFAVLVAMGVVAAGCTTDPYTGERQLSKAAIGAGLGALAGGGIGYLTGRGSDNERRNALIGAGVGALAGGAVGLYMDRQEAALRQRLQSAGVQVERQGDEIRLNMARSVNFDVNRAELRPDVLPVLNAVAEVMREFDRTTIDVSGHTDSDGGADYNQDLSERRAFSVANYMAGQGV